MLVKIAFLRYWWVKFSWNTIWENGGKICPHFFPIYAIKNFLRYICFGIKSKCFSVCLLDVLNIFKAKMTKLRKMMCHPLPNSYEEWYLILLLLFYFTPLYFFLLKYAVAFVSLASDCKMFIEITETRLLSNLSNSIYQHNN